MALTEAQKLDIAKILGVTYLTVNDKITYLGSTYVTDEVETQLIALIAEWEANSVNRDTTHIRPNEKNFGASINPGDLRNIIRREVANLLYFTDLHFSSGQVRLVRG